MDNIDWVEIKEQQKGSLGTGDDEEEEEEEEQFQELPAQKAMLKLMQPGETVLKALKRLGGNKTGKSSASASQRWKAKRAKLDSGNDSEEDPVKKKAFTDLTELADKLLQHGCFEVYQDTYEKLNFKIGAAEKKLETEKTGQSSSQARAEPLDMFADEDDAAATSEQAAAQSTGIYTCYNGLSSQLSLVLCG